MSDEPLLFARMNGAILEVVTDRLTLRGPAGDLVSIEEHVLEVFRTPRDIRVLTMDEASWVLADHVIAPPLQRAA